jgi:hypothetical protein
LTLVVAVPTVRGVPDTLAAPGPRGVPLLGVLPQFWSEPEVFQPDRWTNWQPPHRYAYRPFGAGQRLCIDPDDVDARMTWGSTLSPALHRKGCCGSPVDFRST